MTHRTPKIIAIEGEEPITTQDARDHLEAQAYGDTEIDATDDAIIDGFVAAAREHCEDFLGLSLSTRTLEIALDSFPTTADDGSLTIELPGGPVRDVLSISWGTESDEEMNNDEFTLDRYRKPNLVAPVTAWPSFTAGTAKIKIRYLAGYGVDSDGGEELPAVIRSAMLLMIGHLYENRSESTEKALSTLPVGVQSLLRPRRVRLGMA